MYQKTRCSAIILLFSNKRAYDKGLYDGYIVCPTSNIPINIIEVYIKVVMPAYKFTHN